MVPSSLSHVNCTLLLAKLRSLLQDWAWPSWAPQCTCLTMCVSWESCSALYGCGAQLRLCPLAGTRAVARCLPANLGTHRA